MGDPPGLILLSWAAAKAAALSPRQRVPSDWEKGRLPHFPRKEPPMNQDYMIAGLRVRMDTWGRTASQAKPYAVPPAGDPDLTVQGNPQPLQAAQPHLSLDDCEYLTTGGSFYRQLLSFDGMLLHASAVVVDGFAYLFSAPCGTGKSTHTQQWLRVLADRALILNDDKPALRRENGRWFAYGTPWSGKTSQNQNLRIPLGGVCVLTRDSTDWIEPFSGSAAIFALLEQTARPAGAQARGRLLELVGQLLEEVPVWRLHCTPTENAARVSHAAMAQEAHSRWPSL